MRRCKGESVWDSQVGKKNCVRGWRKRTDDLTVRLEKGWKMIGKDQINKIDDKKQRSVSRPIVVNKLDQIWSNLSPRVGQSRGKHATLSRRSHERSHHTPASAPSSSRYDESSQSNESNGEHQQRQEKKWKTS